MEINKLISEKTLNSDKKKVTIERMEKIEKVIKQLPNLFFHIYQLK